MASFQQVNYCKNCKTNVSVNEKGQCKKCNSSQLNKSWSVRFRYVNEEQKEIQKRLSGFSTKKEANEEYLKFMATAKQFTKLDKQSHDLTFAELYEEFKQFQKTRIKESSYFNLCTKCDLHIKPYFENYKVKSITPKIILDWQNRLDKYSYKHKSNIRTYLSSILKYAEKYYDIPNQIKHVDTFRRIEKPKEMLVWSPEEFTKFIDNVNDIQYKVFFYALFYTGARKGEMLATNWSDWNLKNKILNIDKTLTKKTFNNTPIVTLPKNNSSIRKISLPDTLIDIMKDYKLKYYDESDNECIFKMSETSLTRHKKDACKKAGVKEIRIHDFRHTHASLLISQGVSIVAVAKRLGHSNIEQTLNTYAHLMHNEDLRTIDVLNNCLNNLGTNLGTKQKLTNKN